MAGKNVTDGSGKNVMVRFDKKHRMVRCYADSGSSTGYIAQENSRMFGTPTNTFECSAADASAPHKYCLCQRKPDSELESHSWEDYDGGRRYGIYVHCTSLCDVIMYNCEGVWFSLGLP